MEGGSEWMEGGVNRWRGWSGMDGGWGEWMEGE